MTVTDQRVRPARAEPAPPPAVAPSLEAAAEPAPAPLGHPAWALGARLDRELGDPADPATLFSYREALRQDQVEAFPAEAFAALQSWGLSHYYVPAEYGGRLTSYDQLQQLIRTVARRDLTTAVGHGKTFLGSVSVWGSGDDEVAARLGALVRDGELVSLGLTERTHGSDLMAGEVAAERAADPSEGYLLTGEKWLINNATRGRLLCLLARTEPAGGPRGFTLLLVDKQQLPDDTHRCLPKVPTHGIRGADISGVAYQDAPVGADAMVGSEGGGTELVLKSLQISRTLCPSLSLGAMDAALRLLVRFSRERELYGRRLADLPLTRRTLVDCYADLLLCEALSTVAVRSIQALPDELSVTSAVAKYLVPTIGDEVVATLGGLLGARSFLVDQFAHGRFQKIARDHRIVGIFDGNTLVNLYSLVAQFRSLARRYGGPVNRRPVPASLFDLGATLPPFAPQSLALVSRHGSSILGVLPALVARLRDAARQQPSLLGALGCAEELAELAGALHAGLGNRVESVTGTSPESFDQARRYALCFAGAASLGLWLDNRGAAASDPALWGDARWLQAVLDRVLRRLRGRRHGEPAAAPPSEALAESLNHQYDEGLLFSLLHCPIAEGPPSC